MRATRSVRPGVGPGVFLPVVRARRSSLFELLVGVVVLPAIQSAVFVVVDFNAQDPRAVHVAPCVDLAVPVGVVFQQLEFPGQLGRRPARYSAAWVNGSRARRVRAQTEAPRVRTFRRLDTELLQLRGAFGRRYNPYVRDIPYFSPLYSRSGSTDVRRSLSMLKPSRSSLPRRKPTPTP